MKHITNCITYMNSRQSKMKVAALYSINGNAESFDVKDDFNSLQHAITWSIQ